MTAQEPEKVRSCGPHRAVQQTRPQSHSQTDRPRCLQQSAAMSTEAQGGIQKPEVCCVSFPGHRSRCSSFYSLPAYQAIEGSLQCDGPLFKSPLYATRVLEVLVENQQGELGNKREIEFVTLCGLGNCLRSSTSKDKPPACWLPC